MTKLTLLISSFILFFVSCTSEVKFKPEETEPQIVINGIMLPDQFLKISIHKTMNILEATPQLIDNAKIELWNNNNLLETLTMDSAGYYSTKSYQTVTETEYKLKVYVDGFEEITATDYIPAKQNFEILTFEKCNYSTETSDYFYFLSFSFANTNFEGKYFQFYSPQKYNFHNIHINNYPSSIFSNDPIIQNSYQNSESFVFSGNSLDSIQTINLFVDEKILSSKTYNGYKNLAVLNSISKNYYNYLISQFIYDESLSPSDGMTNDYLLFSNIENGIGIFAGCNPFVDTLIWNNEIVVD